MPEPVRIPTDGAESRSPYTNKLPIMREPIYGGFAPSILVPNGTAAAAGTNSKWFGLIDVAIEDIGQELYLWGATFTQCSCEPDAAGTNQVWGDLYGNGAALVIGINLPTRGRPGVWVDGPCSIPGVEATPTPIVSQSGMKLIHWETFPPGSVNVALPTVPYKRIIPRSFAPFIYRYPYGTRLEAALVIRGSQAANASGVDHTLRGTGEIKLHVGQTRQMSGWSD